MRKRKPKRVIGSKSLIVQNEPMSLVSESYKMFRTNLSYMDIDKENQVLLFTSAQAEEGKTTTIANTALSFAKAGKKTLLIECDLRKARIHDVFNLNQAPGLTNVLAKKSELENVIHNIGGELNLDIVTAGPLPPAPTELLASNAMENFMREARASYDMILIDAPPILNVTDAALLSRLVDGIIMVIAYNETKKDAAIHAKRALDKVGAPVLGAIMTKVEMSSGRGHYYNYGSYYGKG